MGPGEFVISACLAPYPPLQRKFLPGFYVLHGPPWAAQGVPDPWTPRPAMPLVIWIKNSLLCVANMIAITVFYVFGWEI